MFNPLWMYFVEHFCSPPRFHMESTQNPLIDFLNFTKSKFHLQSTSPGGYGEWSGVEETGESLEVD